MKVEVYKEIVDVIKNLNSNDRTCLKILKEKFSSFSENTLGSIVGQEYQRKMKRNHMWHHSQEEEYFNRYMCGVKNGEEPGVLVRLAYDVGMSPSLVAKMVLQQFLTASGIAVPKLHISNLIKKPSHIEDRDMAYEVYLCAIQDDQYGPFTECIKQSIGYEHEKLLQHKLDELNMSYETEQVLRLKGYDKTPDVKLDVPFAINGHIVNWIESKALFGDRECHRVYMRDQYWSYWNRFGSGLVIYWFGFLDNLNTGIEGVMLMDSFPTNITTMDPLCNEMMECSEL